ncbi:ABC transporter substrate-binding protein [Falsigemmobacter faecalis]|uniref:ABC transporter substrate-binding protein n=2 Tax=Falsigemmobacter faecalis TaxID=2488730 RepID=A0A3P3DRS6_9RHOB|nr:ABC transporter substrate-binding protein [Falsigemmobacter faecalis]
MKSTLFAATALLAVSGVALAQQSNLPPLSKNQALHDQLPEKFRTAGKMISVNNGSFPPYEILEGQKLNGASADLSDALSEILGVKIEHSTVGGLPARLTGIDAGRFDFALGPVGDFKSRQEANDFVDWVKEYVVFAVKAGNPAGITSLETACGTRISVMAGGSAERVITRAAEDCEKNGQPKLVVQSFTDQPTSILAVRSGRADAFFSSQAPLSYFVQQSNGELELAGVGQSNGFDDLFQGAVVQKGSPLGPVLLEGIKLLQESGHYQEIMTRWGLENNMLLEPGINLGK